MNGKELYEKLNPLRKALATQGFLPALNRLCFEGQNVHAYNDALAIRTSLDLGFVGGVEGRSLLDYLKVCGEEDISVISGENHVNFVGKSEAKFNIIGEDQFLFKKPREKDKDIYVDEEFIKALRLAHNSLNEDAANLQQLGVYMSVSKDAVTLNCTNDETLSSIAVEISGGFDREKPYIVHPDFTKALIDIYKREDPGDMQICFGESYVSAEVGVYELTGKLINTKPLPFNEMLTDLDEVIKEYTELDIPEDLKTTLRKAAILTNKNGKVSLSYEDGFLIVKAESSSNKFYEEIEIGDATIGDVSIHIIPLAIGCQVCSKMYVTDDFVLMRNDEIEYTYAVSSS